MRKLILTIVAALAFTSVAWAGHRTCTTKCEAYGYCYTSCTDW